ncbi:ABC transporter permease [uncultured Sphingomonas sp.]|uniref:ABC transporter permease n=1 Tax=uncultured Sphingomonas sp. TaxID=158754 RepID=UPI0025CD8BFD|nr:ABC transporter permease [uncultured Sphingomonas sp.]
MTALRRQIRQTLTIARRDFTATVFTPIFLLFLFAPVVMASFGAIGGLGAASVSQGATDKARLVAMLPTSAVPALHGADEQLRPLFDGEARPPALMWRAPASDAAHAAHAALKATSSDVTAVLYGSLDRPAIVYAAGRRQDARYLATVARQAALIERAGSVPPAPRLERVVIDTPTLGGRGAASFAAVFGIFFLTLFLSGQVVGTMAEERNNKVIEILAAAVPLESVFLGKLLGMYGVAVLFIAFWATVLSQIGMLLPGDMGGDMAQFHPAIGIIPFALLFAAYFTTAYLLLGSVFLGVGAQASTMREVQMLSLPITIAQVAMFGLASAAVSHPGSWLAIAAELFPLSSPFAMAGRAAAGTALWPHLALLAWQLLWVAIFITVGARLFRRGVLQSGSARPVWRRLLPRRSDARVM